MRNERRGENLCSEMGVYVHLLNIAKSILEKHPQLLIYLLPYHIFGNFSKFLVYSFVRIQFCSVHGVILSLAHIAIKLQSQDSDLCLSDLKLYALYHAIKEQLEHSAKNSCGRLQSHPERCKTTYLSVLQYLVVEKLALLISSCLEPLTCSNRLQSKLY